MPKSYALTVSHPLCFAVLLTSFLAVIMNGPVFSQTGTSFTQSAKVLSDKANINLTVYPNPVTGNQINLKFANATEGKYHVMLFNSLNQPVYSTAINIGSGNTIYSLLLPQKLSPGYYLLDMINKTGSHIVKKIVAQ